MKAGMSLAVLFLAIPALGGDRPAPDPAPLAKEIDRRVNDKLKVQHVSAASQADDATFFRRINLALAGRIPTAAEVRAFLADAGLDKRAQAIDRLLDSPAFIDHFAKSWRGWLLQEAAANGNAASGLPEFEAWLTAHIRSETPFNKIATELLSYPLDGRQVLNQTPVDKATGPLAFYITHDAKPENLAAATSRVFMGVRLECAECHDHPFARWKKDQFWGLAAFFAGVERQSGGGLREAPGRRELLVPNTNRAAPATFLDDREPEWQYKKSPRATLAAWLTAPENPFFAHAVANRLWWFVFGVGLVDPVDDFHDQNLASHPELLESLARGFVESGYDAKFLLRAICRSESFGRASSAANRKGTDARLFAQFSMQMLSPEQLFESLVIALGSPLIEKPAKENPQLENQLRRQFMETFAATGQPTAAPTSILQALTLMNGDLVNQPAAKSKTLSAALTLTAPADRVEALYLAAFGRLPQRNELQRALRHVEAGADSEKTARYGDVMWALLNSLEFRTNH